MHNPIKVSKIRGRRHSVCDVTAWAGQLAQRKSEQQHHRRASLLQGPPAGAIAQSLAVQKDDCHRRGASVLRHRRAARVEVVLHVRYRIAKGIVQERAFGIACVARLSIELVSLGRHLCFLYARDERGLQSFFSSGDRTLPLLVLSISTDEGQA